MTACMECGLARCACRSGITVVTAAGSTADEASGVALAYLARRGWDGQLLGVRRRRTRLGVMGYRAWDLRYRVTAL
jgi:hypothetical protein